MSAAIQFALNFEIVHCYKCATPFAMTDSLKRRRLDDGQNFWCPLGHEQHFTETTVQKLKRELEQEQKRRGWAEASRDQARKDTERAIASRIAMKGQITKIKKRVSNGVCPNCNRTFINLQRHMATKHPGFAGAAPCHPSEASA